MVRLKTKYLLQKFAVSASYFCPIRDHPVIEDFILLYFLLGSHYSEKLEHMAAGNTISPS